MNGTYMLVMELRSRGNRDVGDGDGSDLEDADADDAEDDGGGRGEGDGDGVYSRERYRLARRFFVGVSAPPGVCGRDDGREEGWDDVMVGGLINCSQWMIKVTLRPSDGRVGHLVQLCGLRCEL